MPKSKDVLIETVGGVDEVPITDAEQRALYAWCYGTPHYSVVRSLCDMALRAPSSARLNLR